MVIETKLESVLFLYENVAVLCKKWIRLYFYTYFGV